MAFAAPVEAHGLQHFLNLRPLPQGHGWLRPTEGFAATGEGNGAGPQFFYGAAPLRERGLAEAWFWHILTRISIIIAELDDDIPEDLRELSSTLAEGTPRNPRPLPRRARRLHLF